MLKVKRALISVSDKTGLLEFARGLHHLGVEILSTGGTAKSLQSAGVPVVEVSQYTGFPEILDGRVKTLHPKIHGGLLALREKQEHLNQLRDQGIGLIDMVVVNLYPFEKVIQKKNVSLEEALENIDVGGPTMLRASAKNFKNVAVVSNPERYPDVLKELNNNSGLLSDAVLIGLAREAFEYTAHYDQKIFEYFERLRRANGFSALPQEAVLHFIKQKDLRYGENPHQKGAFYREEECAWGLAKIEQLHGKELSFNNLLDLHAAFAIVAEFEEPTVAVVKHNNPTGVAQSSGLAKAYQEAWRCDPVSAFGGIIGLNQKVDEATAKAIVKSGFMECVIAPGYDAMAFKILSQKKNIRLIKLSCQDFRRARTAEAPLWDFKQVAGGILLQEADQGILEPTQLKVVTKKKLAKSQMDSLLFGWRLIKYIRSNAILLIKGKKTVGIGCGQTSRIESTQVAIKKAGKNAKGALMISEAFLPKTDNVTDAAKAGVVAIIQSGGSIADEDVIREADKRKIAMVMTGIRHFKH
ncbi:MAG: bifunctional phosphoribosylaminoimidazolecarboxamide formyltransferase/IMP cyclohydrolase [Candidatus Omnitrophica bacterium]|nr:bifunctional phosphoribosylaminoimidazolecarboxamide formyltransferase/IMP cyclohydrolase [Candidatus Omnitrophota bacterium]